MTKLIHSLSRLMLLLGVLFCAVSFTAGAQSGGDFEILSATLDGGGGTSSDLDFDLTGTIGQPEAGTRARGGAFEIEGGFWTRDQVDYLFADSFGTQANR